MLQVARKKWQQPNVATVPYPEPCSPLLECYISLGNVQIQHTPYSLNTEYEEYRTSLDKFPVFAALEQTMEVAPEGTLGLYLMARLLGAYAYAISCRPRRVISSHFSTDSARYRQV